MFNYVIDEKESFFGHKKFNHSKSQNRIFPMLLVKQCIFFLELFSVKRKLEIMFNNVLETKEIFFSHKKLNLSKSQKSHFSTGVNPCFWSKNVLFSLFLFGQNKTRNNV